MRPGTVVNRRAVPGAVRRRCRAGIISLVVWAAVLGPMLTAGPASAQSSSPATNDVTLVMVRADSLSDVGVAVSLVAAGHGDAVLFVEEWDKLGYDEFSVLVTQLPASLLIVGGYDALISTLEDDIRQWLSATEIERIAGRDRIETAALAAERIIGDLDDPTVMLANGWSLPDVGTAASAVATGRADAVLYSSVSGLGAPTRRFIENSHIDSIVMVGGPEALRPEVAQEARRHGHPARVRRVGGATRVHTAALSAAAALEAGARTAVIADGWSLPDVGLAASLAASLGDAVVLYTTTDDLADAAEELVAAQRPELVFVVDTVSGTQHSLLAQLGTSVPQAHVIRINDARQAARYALRAVPATAVSQPPLAAHQGATTLAVGWSHACGLRTDHTITCWGAGNYGELFSPDDTYAAIDAGPGVNCALRPDSTVSCWGRADWELPEVPAGSFVAVSTGGPFACGIRIDDSITCWGRSIYGRLKAPEGTFTAVSNGNLTACAIRIDRTVTCWASSRRFEIVPPEGSFISLSAGGGYACGIRPNQRLECWGSNYDGRPEVIDGTFSAVSAGRASTCALRTDGTIVCWSNDELAEAETPEGTFTEIGIGLGFACALRTDATVHCWGKNTHGQAEAPIGTFAVRSRE